MRLCFGFLYFGALVVGCGSPPQPEAPLTGDGDPSNGSTGTTDLPQDDPQTEADPEPTDPTVETPGEMNAGWIGGACMTPADCTQLSDATCESEGFPNGFCTQTCAQDAGRWLCPDSDDAANTISRCIDASGEPRCVSECDFEQSASGCRSGYTCVEQPRYADAVKTFMVCLPGEGSWPGEPSDIGAACADDTQCRWGACLSLQDGYCTRLECDQDGCPDGSTCFGLTSGSDQIYACLDACTTNDDCRAESYACDADQVCWPKPEAPDSSLGDTDCANAWGTAGELLSPCDAVPDDYVVVNKAARNVALCKQGLHVASFHGALGFAPAGDKEKEGDGKTPEGVFFIPRLVDPSDYYKAFLLSYPDAADASRGQAAGLITTSQRNAIVAAQTGCTEPPQTTGLGGLIELHGASVPGASDWTWGCVAVINSELDQLWAALKKGDTIVVLP